MAVRRRRKNKSAALAERTIREIKQKKLAFLRDVSTILTEALGFQVKVSLSQTREPMTPTMRKFARMPKAKLRQQMADAAQAPLTPRKGFDVSHEGLGKFLNDFLPI